MNHTLKCWPEFFKAVRKREKPFEVRKDDGRGFAVGDTLTLEEFEPCIACNGTGEELCSEVKEECPYCEGSKGGYTGQWLIREVTFVLAGGFGLMPGFVAMGLKECEPKLSPCTK